MPSAPHLQITTPTSSCRASRYSEAVTDENAERYLDLIVETVNGSIYGAQQYLRPVDSVSRVRRVAASAASAAGVIAAKTVSVPASAYDSGEGWPRDRLNLGYSMIGRARLSNVREAVQAALDDEVPGNLIETGVWKGGTCILMRAVLASRAVTDRVVYVADSFAGLPAADESDDAAELHSDPTLAVSQEDVQAAFAKFQLLDDQVRFIKGFFADTLPTLAGTPWAVVRLDGDMYQSTMDGIVNLYPDLSPGGFLIIDDYFTYESCRRAITEYRNLHSIVEEIIPVDNSGAYWRKS